jgi:LemA protein
MPRSIGLAVIILVVVLLVWIVRIYNRLVLLRNRWRNAFSQIDVQLKRRYDLIPNLVETAKGYMAHERQTLEAVIAARNAAATATSAAAARPDGPGAIAAVASAEAILTGNLHRMIGLVENYPTLKADQTMARLMEELASTENKVAFARQAYNDAVMSYNTDRQTFPNNLLAGPFGFGPADLFEIADSAQREVVPVKL